ncbi:sulfite exporter TauE/SafE family protein, partial [Xanthomonas citri pv. citri]|nr:sulfite exporter TauE/SafE family protein [Xanthomonas citri pv. citri]
TGVSVAGALAGVALMQRVPAATLRQAFGWFVLVMGVAVLTVEGASLLA